jgi:hypothetical protein
MARNLEFEDESQAACYIMDSVINGNRSQARKFLRDLYPEQRDTALSHIKDCYSNEQYIELLEMAVC